MIPKTHVRFLKPFTDDSVSGITGQKVRQLNAMDEESRQRQLQWAHRASDDPRSLALAAYARGEIRPTFPGCWKCDDPDACHNHRNCDD